MKYKLIVRYNKLNEILRDVIRSGSYIQNKHVYRYYDNKCDSYCVVGAMMDFITGDECWMNRLGVIEEDIIKECTGVDISKINTTFCHICNIKNEKYSLIDYCIHLNDFHNLKYPEVYEELKLVE